MKVEIKTISKEEGFCMALGMTEQDMEKFNNKRATFLAEITATMFKEGGVAKTEIMRGIQDSFEDREILILALRGAEKDIDGAIEGIAGKTLKLSALLEMMANGTE